MRFACTADLHVGRCSSCDGTAVCDMSALAALGRIVKAAIDAKADGFLIAGDLFDNLAAQYESRAGVVEHLKRLRDHRIPVLAVAGNHDHSALPGLHRVYPDLMMLFGPKWEESRVPGLDGVRFVGRSFESESERRSMFDGFSLPPGDETTVGLVHADINAQSSYGPTPLRDFSGRGACAWVVGHVHVPQTLNGTDCAVAYCGSPQALDWGECGAHGFRWLTIENGKATFSKVIPVSTVRYEYESVDLTPTCDLELKLKAIADSYRADSTHLHSVHFRVNVRLIDGAKHPRPESEDEIVLGEDRYLICGWGSMPVINLEEEAKQKDARALAARLLLGLRGDARWKLHADTLVQRVKSQMAEERKRFSLDNQEDLRCLRQGRDDEASAGVERALERVLCESGSEE